MSLCETCSNKRNTWSDKLREEGYIGCVLLHDVDEGNYGSVIRFIEAEEIEARIEELKTTPNNCYSHRTNFSSPTFSEEYLSEFKQELKEMIRTRQSLQDKLLNLNLSTEITLGEKLVDTLKKYELI